MIKKLLFIAGLGSYFLVRNDYVLERMNFTICFNPVFFKKSLFYPA